MINDGTALFETNDSTLCPLTRYEFEITSVIAGQSLLTQDEESGSLIATVGESSSSYTMTIKGCSGNTGDTNDCK